MSIDLNILKNFDIDNDGILNPDEKSAYDAHAEQNDLVKLKDSVKNLKDNLDLNALGSLDIDGDGLLTSPEAENYKDSNALQLDSSHFAKHSYNMDNDFANQWFNNFNSPIDQNTMTYFLLVKEFGSEEMAIEIMNNAETTEENGLLNMDFTVDGVDYSLNATNDPNAPGVFAASLTNNDQNTTSGVHYNPAYENGVSFAREYTNEHGSRMSEWENAGGLTVSSDGFVLQGFDENGMGFNRYNVTDANNYSQVNNDGTLINVEDGLIVSGNYSNGVGFTREHSTVDNLSYIERQSNGQFLDVRSGQLVAQGDATHIPEQGKSITEGVSSYRQEYGLILGGVLENGLEFERFDIIDNKNYYQVNSDGSTSQVVNGEIVSQDDDFGISDRGMRFANLQSLEDMDTSIVDPDGSKFNRMMNAFNINSTESIDYYDSWIDDWVGTGPVDDSLKNNIVDKFLLAFGNDEQFMQAIEENGFNITVAGEIKGSNPYGNQWDIGGFYSPLEDEQGRNTIVISEEALNSIVFTHEFAHARDHLVDGSIDGSFGDIDTNTFDNAIAISRERANNGAAQGLFDLDYANTNEQEFLAEMFEGYYLDPVLFEQRFPEFTAALGETFDHLDQTVGLLSLNETTTDRMFDDFQNIPSYERFA